ncbi:MAG: bifunctional (p)ppGpp synthetase/guanosine-3',5'-bis(diphosphate) 3'-pyrophosphohydrolase [Proteobacteria bacterium]|nr:bifunctional (p)ppGpp synthetase/guanosine-3',5'-bis(diphosphate) 3'-pyrophosphohydrolase [Pseudomonadota bacterium]MBU1594295.1 bifunctional (p)ppGpp synthetase/guanosine-3',5'-bis(diphosphate) 3'-pyrophosphohydrolase [Pseudomonadota bacterium]
MIRINEITDKVATYIDKPDLELIQKAYIFTAQAHAGQTRLSGEPYLSHPMSVANILADMKLDEPTVAAGLLHDTVEDTGTSIDEIEELFGDEVADIVDGVTKISKMQFESKAVAQAENIRKMILAMAEDIRVLMVKLADRLHNMRTLDFQPSVKQRLISQETLEIYAPLANRLGLHRTKVELEDLCLKYMKPDVYEQIDQGVASHHTSGQEYIDKVKGLIGDMLTENNIKGRVAGRTKHRYSIYSKMLQQNLGLDQIFDLIAFRIIVGNLKDCYAVLGLIHSIWKPVTGRFKDYISIPKANMYQSLHTTVIGPDGERIEIQIRTEEMNRVAEYGVATHWQYKEKGKKGSNRDAERFTWLRQILDWQRDLQDPREFMASLRIDLFQDEVYVFTPRGDIKELPEGATPVDFAYTVHTKVGDHCAGAKVNGRLVPLGTPLKNGDRVEIITDNHRNPSRDWLKFVKTARARTRIKQYIRTEERDRSISLAREMLEKEGRKVGVNFAKAMKEGLVHKLVEEFSCPSVDELLSQVGYARLTPRKVLQKLYGLLHPGEKLSDDRKPPEPAVPALSPAEAAKIKKSEGIKLSGVDDVLFRFASCCNPLPGEPIVGYITRGRGVTIHAHDCTNIKGFEPDRVISVSWDGVEDKPYPAKIRIVCRDFKGALSQVTALLTSDDVNIHSGSFQSNMDGNAVMEFTVEVKDLQQLYGVLAKIRDVESVTEAVRVS